MLRINFPASVAGADPVVSSIQQNLNGAGQIKHRYIKKRHYKEAETLLRKPYKN